MASKTPVDTVVENLNNYFGNDFGNLGNNLGNDFGNLGKNLGNDFGNLGKNLGNNTGNDFGNLGNDFGEGVAAGAVGGSILTRVFGDAPGFTLKKLAIVVVAILVVIAVLYGIYYVFFKKDECTYLVRVNKDGKWVCPDGTIDTGRSWEDENGQNQCAVTQQCVDALGPAPAKCSYSTRIASGDKWVCPDGMIDTGRSWEHVDGEKQCQTTACPPAGTPVLKECVYSVRVNKDGKWVCPDGTVDTGRSWEHQDGQKQCTQSKECADALGPAKPLVQTVVCSPLQVNVNGKCVCDASKGVVSKDGDCVCADGYIWNGTTCVKTQCPDGQVMVNGKCACPLGQIVGSGGKCVCAPGYRSDGFGCSPVPEIPSPKPPAPAPKPTPTPAPKPAPKPAPVPPPAQGDITVPGTIVDANPKAVRVSYSWPNGKAVNPIIPGNNTYTTGDDVGVVIKSTPPYTFVRLVQKTRPNPAPVPRPVPAPKPVPRPVPAPTPVPTPAPSGSACSGLEGGEPYGSDGEPYFYICEPGRKQPTQMPCAEGTVWDTAVNVCNWPKGSQGRNSSNDEGGDEGGDNEGGDAEYSFI
ncbi:hypothetical protein ATCVMN08101_531L [Acanthocystis turfacea Chlorella virus MN0810.1]|nr:hypothetical protein ATCVMN08101_531L [Acanthocystis turfacea Chlorella virus MN0810.1]